MKPAVDTNILYQRMEDINVDPRTIRRIKHDDEWNSLLYRNHQIAYLKNHLPEGCVPFISVKDLMYLFDLSETPVRRAIKADYKVHEEPGRCLSLDCEKENLIIDHIVDSYKKGSPLTQVQIRSYVRENFKIPATKGWIYSFIQRHSDVLKKATSFPQEDTRLTVPVEFLVQHIENMNEIVNGVCSELLFNLDEMGSSDWEDRKTKKVIVPNEADPKSIFHKTSRKFKHQTLLSIISAGGDALTPLIITSTNVEKDLNKLGYRSGEDAIFKVRSPAYIDENIFLEYIQSVFIPYVKTIRENPVFTKEPRVLLMDSCSSHLNPELLALLGANGIKVVTYPAHTTNTFQPLDLSLFGIIKKLKI